MHSLASGTLGFRGIFALAVVPLVVVYAVRGRVEEPSRFMVAEAAAEHPTPVLGAVGRATGTVVVLALIAFAISVITGPANSFVFLYAQDVLHQAGYVTALMVVAAGVTGLLGLLAGRGWPTMSAAARRAPWPWSPSPSAARCATRVHARRSWSATPSASSAARSWPPA